MMTASDAKRALKSGASRLVEAAPRVRRIRSESLDGRKLHTYAETCILLGLGDTKVRELADLGHLRRVKIGAAARITRASIDKFLAEIEGNNAPVAA